MNGDPDALVIGSGPNGLVAACVLAMAGLSVLVVESHPTRAGGALGSEEATLPGFVHDVGASFFPFSEISPAFRALQLQRHGLHFDYAAIDSAHPAPDGSCAILSRDLELMRGNFGSTRDGDRWHRIATWHRRVEARLVPTLLSTFPPILAGLRLGPLIPLHAARLFARSGGNLARRLFETEAARRVMPGLALHADVAPGDMFGAAVGYMLAAMATSGGYGVPRGGASAITQALIDQLKAHGGALRLGAKVVSLLGDGRRSVGVRLADGEEIRVKGPILADTAAPSLFLQLARDFALPGRLVRRMERFPHAWGTLKLDWALKGAVPWSDERCARSAVVHLGDSLADLDRFAAQVRAGELPTNPYLVIGQQSLADSSRAPNGHHTLWAYTRVPVRVDGSWTDAGERLADRIDERIEAQAPGFRAQVLARRVVTPPQLEGENANLVGGDLCGGTNAWTNQLIFRPAFPWFRYKTPVRGLYLCSSYTHPGPGVHGMCGYNAAQQALSDHTRS